MARQSIGEFLATLRRAQGYTQQEVADKLDVSNRTVSAWERDSSLPDILLLPVIAELYNVTVDEILAGARSEHGSDLPALSQKSETALLRKKLSRFTSNVFILLGVFIVGLIVLFFGWYSFEVNNSPAVSYRPPLSTRWELIPISVGVVTVVGSLAAIVALWCGAEVSIDNSVAGKRDFCIAARRLVSVCACIAGVVSMLLAVILTIFAVTNAFYVVIFSQMEMFIITYLALGVILLLVGLFVSISIVRRYADDEMRVQVKNNRKLLKKISLWGLIPFVTALTLAIVFSYVYPTGYTVIYASDDRDQFREHMETLYISSANTITSQGVLAGNYYFNMTELAATARIGQEIDAGNGFIVTFLRGPYDCEIKYVSGETTYRYYCKRHDLDGFAVYDVYYRYTGTDIAGSTHQTRYGSVTSQYVVEKLGEKYVFASKATYDLSMLFIGFGAVTAVTDIAVCIAIYFAKREKSTVKL